MICDKCGRHFTDYRTPENKLIQAIFGQPLCKDCFEGRDTQPCTSCGEPALAPVFYNNKPYHPRCLAEELNLKEKLE